MVRQLTPAEREARAQESAQGDQLLATARTSECCQCAGRMTVATKEGALVLRCAADPSHQGYRARKSLTQLHHEGYVIPYVSDGIERKRRRKLEEIIGTEESKAVLAPYPGERYLITPEAARRAIHALWPGAGQDAKVRCELICAQHNLNPLDKEIFIGTMNEGKPNQVDVVMLGIPGNRKIARRKAHFRYVDGGSRAMTKVEVEEVRGNYDKDLWCICVLEMEDGTLAIGRGSISLMAPLIGGDKGNTHFRMASIRAEREALAKIVPPKDLPAPLGMEIEGVFYDISEVVAERASLPAPSSRPTPPRLPASSNAPVAFGEATPLLSPEHEKLRGFLGDAGFLTPDGRLRADKSKELRDMLSKYGAVKLSDLRGEALVRFENQLLDLAIVRLEEGGNKEETAAQLPLTP